jgi:DNA/RNA-binding domain of Phe-tRNA-synthetase-like protein
VNGPSDALAAEADHVPEEGWIADELRAEFPELRLVSTTVAVPEGSRRTTPGIRARLRVMSDRFHGAQALSMRRQAVPHAYRVFFREIGLDPDETRTPVEGAAFDRLVHGGYESRGLLADALLLALVETGVPVWALDADAVSAPLGVRLATRGERLGGGDLAPDLGAGQMIAVDENGPVALLFGDVAVSHRAQSRTRRLLLFSVQVAGVPAIHVEEALWACASTLSTGSDGATLGARQGG